MKVLSSDLSSSVRSPSDARDSKHPCSCARIAYEDLQPLVAKRDSDLDQTLKTRFKELQSQLGDHKDGDGFRLYTELSKDEVKELSDGVNALSEPLSKLTDTVVG